MSEPQIIVLYASLDDKAESSGQNGWITTLLDNLSQLLKRLSGREYSINRLSEYDLDPDSFPLENSLIIPVISHNMLQAPIFMSYLSVIEHEVIKKRKSKKKMAIVDFITIFRHRISSRDIPGFLLEGQKHHFYEVDGITDFVTEIKFTQDPEKDHNYWMKVFDIAIQIRSFYDNVRSPVGAAEKLINDMKPEGIYIARTGADQDIERENLIRELTRSQYKIYQLESIEENYEDVKEEINLKLSKCKISIHLVGEDSGYILKDKGLAIPEIENQLASDHSRQINDKPGVKYYDRFNRIIWLSNLQENLTVKQKIFIDNLRKDLDNLKYAEIIECPIEALKGFIVSKMKSHKQQDPVLLTGGESKKSIYLICDITEREACYPISEHLENQGYEVVFSNFDGEVLQIRDNHLRNLKECDGTLIYYGKNNQNWVKSKLFDSVKALGMGRSKDKNPTAIIVDSTKKVDLDLHFGKENLILLKSKKINKNTFKSFLNQLE